MSTRVITKGAATYRVASERGSAYDRFWDWFESPTWEPDTVEVFSRCLRPDSAYVDFGAWIGPTVLLAGSIARRVVCVEPDPVAREHLERNLALNESLSRKVRVHGFAIAAADGTAELAAKEDGGNSLSSLLHRHEAPVSWTVETVGIQSFLRRGDVAGSDFFKFDVEGAEYEVIPRMRAYIHANRPSIYLSTHAPLLFDKSSLRTRLSSGVRALYLNWRMLKTLLAYRHHYVFDADAGRLVDIRLRNLLRVLIPLPLRASFLIESCLFTDERL